MIRKLLMLVAVASLGLSGTYALASPQEYFRIARLSYLEGKVSFQHTDEIDWTAASINLPLQPGDRLYTGDNGRAEIEFDDGSVLRLAARTDVEILSMREQLIQVRVLVGLCSLTERSSVDFEVDTPAAAFTTAAKGFYRFDVAENGDTQAVVRKGRLDAVNDRMSRRVDGGQLLSVPASANESESLASYRAPDAWDEWNDRRDADMMAYESRRYLPEQVSYGAYDLDRYGRWVTVDGYGAGWVPRVGVSWSPYWDGRWVYRPYWGWTWVSYEPWGWLPYHYGRWHHSASFGWTWFPGAAFSFHFWSPGLVRFYHGPDHIRWCPLGPGDYYNVNNYFYNNTYAYYLTNLRLQQRRGPDDLINRNVAGALRSVRTDQFVNGGTIGGPSQQLQPGRGERVVTGALDVRPSSRSYAPLPDRAAEGPASRQARPVIVRSDPQIQAPRTQFQRVPSTQLATPRMRESAREPGAVSQPPARGMENQPERSAPGARIYQAPSSRTGSGEPPGAAREVQRMPDRQPGQSRTQTPPSVQRSAPDMPARRMESAPPRTQRNEQMTAPPSRTRPDSPPAAAPRQEMARPPAQSRPSSPPPSRPPDRVIKKNDSGRAPSGYQPSAGLRQRPAESRSFGSGSRPAAGFQAWGSNPRPGPAASGRTSGMRAAPAQNSSRPAASAPSRRKIR